VSRLRRAPRALGARAAVIALAAAGVTLTGSAAAGAPAYPADRPNTLAGARTAAPVAGAVWVTERLSSATDEDWYRFDVARTATVNATLGSLPADYSLSVYDSTGRLVGSSNRKNLGFERVTWRASRGSYFVRVDAVRGFSATKQYALRMRAMADGVVVLSLSPILRYHNGWVGGWVEFVNTTPTTHYQVNYVEMRLVNAQGRVLASDTEATTVSVLRPGRTSKVQWQFDRPVPAGVTAVRFTPVVEAVAPRTWPALSITRAPTTTHPDGYLVYRGTISTTSPSVVEDAMVDVTYYDARGNISTHTSWGVRNIPAHGSKTFAVPFQSLLYTPELTKPNVLTVQPDLPWPP
jgi:hypothetical protein